MSCYDEKTIIQYLDGELPSEQFTAFKNHINGCSACSSLVEEYADVYQQLGAVDFPEPETTFTAKVIKSLPPINFKRKKKIARAVYASLILLLLFLNIALIPFRPFWHDIGDRWDVVKICWHVLTQLTAIALMLLRAILLLTVNLLEWISAFRRLLYPEPTIMLLFSFFILLASIIFIKHITCKNKMEELIK